MQTRKIASRPVGSYTAFCVTEKFDTLKPRPRCAHDSFIFILLMQIERLCYAAAAAHDAAAAAATAAASVSALAVCLCVCVGLHSIKLSSVSGCNRVLLSCRRPLEVLTVDRERATLSDVSLFTNAVGLVVR